MAWIYLITNIKNNKKYVGYTKYTPEERFKKHWEQRFTEDVLFHRALKKYGKNSFEVIGLEEIDEQEWAEKETYWIEKINSKVPKGYNICPGGNKPPIQFGSNNNKSKLSDLEESQIINDLLDYELNFHQISIKYNISESQVERINKGDFRNKEDLIYPLRSLKRDQFLILQIINDLKNPLLSQYDIEKRNNIISRARLYNINNGKVGSKLFPQDFYPIRPWIINRKPLYLFENL